MIDHPAILTSVAFAGGFLVRHLAEACRRPRRIDPISAAALALAYQSGVTAEDLGVIYRAGQPHQYVIGELSRASDEIEGELPVAIIDATREDAICDVMELAVSRAELRVQMIEAEFEQEVQT